jgi:hypothetical protein
LRFDGAGNPGDEDEESRESESGRSRDDRLLRWGGYPRELTRGFSCPFCDLGLDAISEKLFVDTADRRAVISPISAEIRVEALEFAGRRVDETVDLLVEGPGRAGWKFKLLSSAIGGIPTKTEMINLAQDT